MNVISMFLSSVRALLLLEGMLNVHKVHATSFTLGLCMYLYERYRLLSCIFFLRKEH